MKKLILMFSILMCACCSNTVKASDDNIFPYQKESYYEKECVKYIDSQVKFVLDNYNGNKAIVFRFSTKNYNVDGYTYQVMYNLVVEKFYENGYYLDTIVPSESTSFTIMIFKKFKD
jgi:hypothetical protein